MSRRRSLAVINSVLFALLAVTIAPVAKATYGAVVVSQGLFGLACAACVGVVVCPGNRFLRAGSGAVVGFAFAWRATSVLVTWLEDGSRSFYGVVLYVGLATVFTVGWAEMLPTRPGVREAIDRLRRDG